MVHISSYSSLYTVFVALCTLALLVQGQVKDDTTIWGTRGGSVQRTYTAHSWLNVPKTPKDDTQRASNITIPVPSNLTCTPAIRSLNFDAKLGEFIVGSHWHPLRIAGSALVAPGDTVVSDPGDSGELHHACEYGTDPIYISAQTGYDIYAPRVAFSAPDIQPSFSPTPLRNPTVHTYSAATSTWVANEYSLIRGGETLLGCSPVASPGLDDVTTKYVVLYMTCAVSATRSYYTLFRIDIDLKNKNSNSATWSRYDINTTLSHNPQFPTVGEIIVKDHAVDKTTKTSTDTIICSLSDSTVVIRAMTSDDSSVEYKVISEFRTAASSGYSLRLATLPGSHLITAYTFNMPDGNVIYQMDTSTGRVQRASLATDVSESAGQVSLDDDGNIWALAQLNNASHSGHLYKLSNEVGTFLQVLWKSEEQFYIGTGSGLSLLPGALVCVFNSADSSLLTYNQSNPTVGKNISIPADISLNSFMAPVILSTGNNGIEQADAIVIAQDMSLRVIPLDSYKPPVPEVPFMQRDVRLPVAVLIIVGAFLLGALSYWITSKCCCRQRHHLKQNMKDMQYYQVN